jgi:hypothetical protein
MSSDAQIAANQINAQSSTGPRTEEGKEVSSRNNLRHGLASSQLLIAGEDPEEWQAMYDGFFQDHKPSNTTEAALVKSMAQHHWFAQRAVRLQTEAFSANGVNERKLAVYLRYQTTHERAFHKCLSDLLKLRATMAKELIGFESQKQKEALNEAKIRSLDAKTRWTEIESDIKQTIEAPLPGNFRIPFDKMKPVIQAAVRDSIRDEM